MEKVGIITHYYNSINYGGILQSYALQKMVEKCGLKCEQICFDTTNKNLNMKPVSYKIKVKMLIKKLITVWCNSRMKVRYSKLNDFRNSIPHSLKVYDENNIESCIDDYNVFISGSDQVWNMKYYFSQYFLDFVPSSKIKFSYAASLGNGFLSDEDGEIIHKHITDYRGVSVREKDSVNLLTGLYPGEINCSLDPTLLLDREDWDKIASHQMVNKPYIFCYFIGDDNELRKIAKKYAKEQKKKLVVLSHPAGFNFSDVFFGKIKEYEAGIEDFISLIKYADCILTDSFHCCVFSIINHRQFWVFNRNGKLGMSSRIISLLSLFDMNKRFYTDDPKKFLIYSSSQGIINYQSEYLEYNEMKKESKNYLLKQLKGA